MTPPTMGGMSSVDTAWLRMDTPSNAMMIVCVMATATRVASDEFRRMLETRFLCFLRPAASGQDRSRRSWVEGRGLDLRRAFRREGCGRRAATPRIAGAGGRGWPAVQAGRPLWQLHFVEDYLGGSAWVMRICTTATPTASRWSGCRCR
ncbi:MAG: hypothetical protein IPF50_15875 [Proteobacteria bacterium]|nr:hypothetical protein [Pseudomonadota bacterium]